MAATLRLGCTSESKHATYLRATVVARSQPLCRVVSVIGLHARARSTPRGVTSHESSFTPPATSSPHAGTLAGAQPPSTFLRPSADYTNEDSPTLFHVGATHGVQRTWARSERSRKVEHSSSAKRASTSESRHPPPHTLRYGKETSIGFRSTNVLSLMAPSEGSTPKITHLQAHKSKHAADREEDRSESPQQKKNQQAGAPQTP